MTIHYASRVKCFRLSRQEQERSPSMHGLERQFEVGANLQNRCMSPQHRTRNRSARGKSEIWKICRNQNGKVTVEKFGKNRNSKFGGLRNTKASEGINTQNTRSSHQLGENKSKTWAHEKGRRENYTTEVGKRERHTKSSVQTGTNKYMMSKSGCWKFREGKSKSN